MDYRERHRMYLFWQSRFYSTNRACDICGFDRGITVKEERYMTRDEYCGTCHKEIYATGSGHSRHAPQSVHCVDCHTPQVAAGGNRYSIHDHKFDFSGPELPCSECHTEKETAGKKAPPHDFPFRRVELQDTLTLEQACARCHTDRDHADTLRNGNTLSGSVE
jgi:formate-dependent nitrite reductase cytochrome c552 subunit